MSSNRDHAFVTTSQTSLAKSAFQNILQQLNVTSAVIVLEQHEDGGNHIHAVLSGKFRPRDFHQHLRKLLPDKAHLSVLYAHQPKTEGKRGAAWPIEDMIAYLTTPAKDKYVDSEPLLHNTESLEDFVTKHYERNNIKAMFLRLSKLKQEDYPQHAVIQDIAAELNHENQYLYRIFLEYYKSLPPPVHVISDPHITMYEWQKAAIGWANLPISHDSNNRGLFLRLAAGAGKSVLSDYLHDTFPRGVFYPGYRPNGKLDLVSFMSYNGEGLIIIGDLSPTHKDNVPVWSEATVRMLKVICDNSPLCFEFAGQYIKKYIRARILVTSNYALINDSTDCRDTGPLNRRYIQMSTRAHPDETLARPVVEVSPDEIMDYEL